MYKLAVFVAIGVALVGAVAPAAGTDFAWEATGEGKYWDQTLNWNPDGRPVAGDTVTIPSGSQYQCRIRYDEACTSYSVAGSARLIVEAGGSLTISADSTTDSGFLELNGDDSDTADLIIAASLSIGAVSSDRGIRMSNGRILPAAGVTPTLTFYDENDDTDPPSIRGDGDIQVKLVNEGLVQASNSGKTLKLTSGEKQATYQQDGSGQWQARDGGILQVETTVTGSGKWAIFLGSQSEIIINHCLSDLTGDVELTTGKITYNEPFCTTGQVKYKGAAVKVKSGKSTKDGGSSCPASFCP